MKRIFNNIIRKEKEGGHVSFCPELSVYSQGETIEKAKANLIEAEEYISKVQRNVGF